MFDNKFRALILDMDGVIVDSESVHVDAFRIYLKNNRISYTEELLNSLIGFSVEDNIRKIQEDLWSDREKPPLRESIAERNRIYLEQLKNHRLETMPGIDDIIQHCLQHNILLGLATSSPLEQVNAILSTVQGAYAGKYEQVFHATVNGEEVTHKKPAADIYNLICKKLGVAAKTAVAVEDSPAGVQSARRAGLFTFGVTSRYYNHNQLDAADLIVNSARDILPLLQ